MEIEQHISKKPSYRRNQKGNQKISRSKWQCKHDISKPMRCSKSTSKRKFYSNTILPHETRKTLKRQPNFAPKTTGKITKSPKISRRKKIRKIPAEINERNNTED